MPTISALTAASALAGTEVLPVVQSGATDKATINQIKTYIAGLTTKGDLLSFSTVNVRIAVSATDGFVPLADSSATPGIAWGNPNKTFPVRGITTLILGTKVVSNAAVTANSQIQLTAQSLGTVTVPSALAVSARTAGVSFTILASDLSDTSVVAWQIIEPSA